MKTFTDNTGRAWQIAINVDAVKRVKGLLGVDLMEATEGRLLERLISEPILLCDLVYALCKPQADAAHVTDEDFGRAMAGDAIEAATGAMLEELVDFFPSRRRALLAKAVGKLRTLETMVLTAAENRLDSPELETQLQQGVQAMLASAMPPSAGRPSGDSPGSPASSPAS